MDARLVSALPLRLPPPAPLAWAGAITINLLGLALPLVVLQVYDRVLPNAATATLALLALGLAGALCIDGLLRAARGALAAWAAARFEHRALVGAAARLLSADAAAVARDPVGAWMDRFAAIDRLAGQAAADGRFLLVDLAFAGLFLAVLTAISAPLGWSVALVLAGAATATWALARAQNRALSARNGLDDHRLDFLLQSLTGFATIKALAAEALMLRRMERLQSAGADRSWQVVRLAGLAQSAAPLLTGAVMGITAGFGALAVAEGRLSAGGLAAAVLLAGRLAQPCLKAIAMTGQVEAARLARRRLSELAGLDPVRPTDRLADRPTDTAADTAPAIDPTAPAVRIAGWRAEAAATPDVAAAPIDIEPGEVVLIDGPGARALLRAVAGLGRPAAGQVTVTGQDAAVAGGRLVQFAGPVPALFTGSLLDNATGFDLSRIDAALNVAAELGLAADVSRLAEGWETAVSSSDRRLPEGLRQKIALTRILAADPPVMALDHPSGALDRDADALLLAALAARRGRTTILIATPRPSVRRLATRRLLAGPGGLVETPIETAPTPVPGEAAP